MITVESGEYLTAVRTRPTAIRNFQGRKLVVTVDQMSGRMDGPDAVLGKPRSVPFESVLGSTMELLIFLAAQQSFQENEPRTKLYYLIKWAFEELALFLSWEFWERPHFRTIMLRQLTVRNILFQLRYLPNFEEWSLRKVYMMQPVVVLTLAIVHIVTERVAIFQQDRFSEAQSRKHVSKLFTHMGVHLYLALVVASFVRAPNTNLLWLRTCLATLVFQNGMLMFVVIFFVLAFDDVTLLARVMDLVTLSQSIGMITQRLRERAGLHLDFSLDSIRSMIQGMAESTESELRSRASHILVSLHVVAELLGFVFGVIYVWSTDESFLLYCAVSFSSAVALLSASRDDCTRPELVSYFIEMILTCIALGVACLETYWGLLDSSIAIFTCRGIVCVACSLACSGLQELVRLSLL